MKEKYGDDWKARGTALRVVLQGTFASWSCNLHWSCPANRPGQNLTIQRPKEEHIVCFLFNPNLNHVWLTRRDTSSHTHRMDGIYREVQPDETLKQAVSYGVRLVIYSVSWRTMLLFLLVAMVSGIASAFGMIAAK